MCRMIEQTKNLEYFKEYAEVQKKIRISNFLLFNLLCTLLFFLLYPNFASINKSEISIEFLYCHYSILLWENYWYSTGGGAWQIINDLVCFAFVHILFLFVANMWQCVHFYASIFPETCIHESKFYSTNITKLHIWNHSWRLDHVCWHEIHFLIFSWIIIYT